MATRAASRATDVGQGIGHHHTASCFLLIPTERATMFPDLPCTLACPWLLIIRESASCFESLSMCMFLHVHVLSV